MISLAEFLLNVDSEFNQHKQTEIKGIPLEEGMQLCNDLEELTHGEYFFVCEVYTDGSYSIIQKGYWGRGEHDLGHDDRVILSVGNP